MDIFLNRYWDAKWTWLLAGNGGIPRGFSSGSQYHEGWGCQGIGQVGGALHLEGCPVEVHSGWKKEVGRILGGGGDDSSLMRFETMSKTLGKGSQKRAVWKIEEYS